VDDIAIHPRENDLILGTHGRSIWVLDDITPLEQLSKDMLAEPAFLFDIRSATIFNSFSHKGNLGHKFFVAPNPSSGTMITYYLKEKLSDGVKILIQDESGKNIVELKGSNQAGINRVIWNLRYQDPKVYGERLSPRERPRGPAVLPDEYSVVLKAGDKEMSKRVQLEMDPRVEVSLEELKARQEILLDLYFLYPMMNSAKKWILDTQPGIESIANTLKRVPNVPEAVTSSVKTISKGIWDVQLQLFGDPELSLRRRRSAVLNRLMSLSSEVGRFTGTPTKAQLQQIEEQIESLIANIQKLNKVIEIDIPMLNQLLEQHDIPRLIPGEKIQLK
jgi:archaellum component FlaC